MKSPLDFRWNISERQVSLHPDMSETLCMPCCVQGLPLCSSLPLQQSFSFPVCKGLHQRARFFTQPALALSCKSSSLCSAAELLHEGTWVGRERGSVCRRMCRSWLDAKTGRFPFSGAEKLLLLVEKTIIPSLVSGTAEHFMPRGLPDVWTIANGLLRSRQNYCNIIYCTATLLFVFCFLGKHTYHYVISEKKKIQKQHKVVWQYLVSKL